MRPRPDELLRRIEASTPGRAAISILILVTLLAVLVTNLPDSALRRSLAEKTQPYLNAIGLDQNWGVFAPDPRRQVLELEATITYRGGRTESWRPPVRDDFIGAYSDYHWQKIMENTISEDGPGYLTTRLAKWLLRERADREPPPVRISIVRRLADLAPPGPLADRPLSFAEKQLIRLRITDRLLREARQ